MKTLTILVLLLSIQLHAQNVHILDPNFKKALLENNEININGDQEIQMEEARAFEGGISVSRKGIKSLKGIEAFINLSTLNCSNNKLEEVDLSNNVKLVGLYCNSNKLVQLNLKNNINLSGLFCSNNELKQLDLKRNLQLKTIYCYSNNLRKLHLKNNINLSTLFCSNNKLKQLDLRRNIQLKGLDCYNNKLKKIDLISNINLHQLNVYNNRLSTLDITKNTKLWSLNYSHNLMKNTVSFDNYENLKQLWCSQNSSRPFDTFWDQVLHYNNLKEYNVSMLGTLHKVELNKFGRDYLIFKLRTGDTDEVKVIKSIEVSVELSSFKQSYDCRFFLKHYPILKVMPDKVIDSNFISTENNVFKLVNNIVKNKTEGVFIFSNLENTTFCKLSIGSKYVDGESIPILFIEMYHPDYDLIFDEHKYDTPPINICKEIKKGEIMAYDTFEEKVRAESKRIRAKQRAEKEQVEKIKN